MTTVPCYILAGGANSRFGRDKAREIVLGRPLILHAAALVAEASDSVTVVSGREGEYDDLGLATIADDDPGLGPLAGLARALRHACDAHAEEADCVLLAPCDWLGARPSWLVDLVEARRPGDLAVAYRGTHWEPLPAIYSTDVLDLARAGLHSGGRSLQVLLDRCSARFLTHPRDWTRSVRVNRPEDVTAYLESRDRA
jgi:molybdenum cofactor guanylyltransferase